MTFDGSSPAANTNADKLFRGDREVVTSIVYNFLSKKKDESLSCPILSEGVN